MNPIFRVINGVILGLLFGALCFLGLLLCKGLAGGFIYSGF